MASAGPFLLLPLYESDSVNGTSFIATRGNEADDEERKSM